jgi:PIN domain nuclease of toxin-antitoxin system
LNLLPDTHALLWWLFDDPALSPRAREAISERHTRVFVSSASAWEMAIKWRLGRLPEAAAAVTQLPDLLVQAGFDPLPITVAHALTAGALPADHKDPFDRMLVAQAETEDLLLVSTDATIAALTDRVFW